MGNLVLGRGEGQSVRLTHNFWAKPIFVEVGRVTGGDADFLIVCNRVEIFMKLKLMESYVLAPEVVMTAAGLRRGRVKLSFNAPLTVSIMRTELGIGCDE